MFLFLESEKSRFTNLQLKLTNINRSSSLSISGSSSYAVLNQPFTLTCTVSQAAGLSGLVQLFTKKSPNVAFVALSQNVASCSVFNPPAEPLKYSASCGSGTDSSSSSTKKYHLRINRAAERDVTDWWCDLVTAGTRSNTFSLQFSSGPDSVTFSPPSPRSVAEGDGLIVTCAATGCNPPCSCSWNLRNQQISPTSQLKLTNINRSQTGNVYTCTATNPFLSTSETKQFTLTVYYGPDSVQLNTTSPLTVKEGDNVAVSCEATNCSPSCSFTWKFKSQIKSASSVLSLNNINRYSAGDYTCTARTTNTQKSLDKIISLDVHYRSSITSLTLNSQSTRVTVEERSPVTLRCDVDSNPGYDIKLLNTSQTLREVSNSKQAEYTWNEAGCLDTGHYTCEAGNNIKSTVSESVQLVVRCSSRLDYRVPFQDVFVVAIGGAVSLRISVIANPTPAFAWYKLTGGNNNSLGSGRSATTGVSAVGELTLTNVQQGDIGTYQVVVSNGAPRQDLMVNLKLYVAGPPSIPSGVSAWANGPHSILVVWLELFNGGSDQMFLVQYRADTTLLWTNITEQFPGKGINAIQKAVISNLQPNSRYLMRVLAYNRYGYKGFTKNQEALTLPSAPSSTLNGEGIAVGIVIGIAISAVIVTVTVFILWRRGHICPSSKSDTNIHR
ncbi:MAM domain-containing glycosylphosphatidylinositol anchor protein 2-like [Gigantopelta aegis]|uniref:MAM domain-containing glycosylphosphatidylinositol anchor protein 2-like n=1 Tax=Gigantopelta aegis TaxID=1735272 RepID=UPI001B8876D0|nr:MAM domain-containing glycosylphosphatidylinositol anchor protein 2-like [Gigantopelta aegis]